MRMTLPVSRPLALAGTAVLSSLLLSACGSSSHSGMNMGSSTGPSTGPSSTSSYGPAASGPHNAADVSFASDMIPHHAQAVEMASMALDQATNAKIKELATAIKGAQDPEINTMSGWLTGWGETVPVGNGHAMAGMSMTGMMTDAQMQELSQAKGAAFDRLWVQMMTRHHQGAVEMATTELKMGQNSEAKALATKIITAQTGEIAQMAALLKTLPA
jgi:uncharacterized protein (DUF305 family)